MVFLLQGEALFVEMFLVIFIEFVGLIKWIIKQILVQKGLIEYRTLFGLELDIFIIKKIVIQSIFLKHIRQCHSSR